LSDGINPLGRRGIKLNDPTKKIKAITMVLNLLVNDHFTRVKYFGIHDGWVMIFFFGFIRYAAIIGVNNLATTKEAKTANAAVHPNCLKNIPGTPLIKAVGKNTAIKVAVVAITASPISWVASMAAK